MQSPPAPPRAHDKNESYTRFSEDIHVFFFSFYVLSICVMCQKSRVNWRCSAVFTINVEYIEHINLAFLVLIFSPLLPTDLVINNSNRLLTSYLLLAFYSRVINTSVAFSEPYQISKMDPYAKIVNRYITTFTKSSISDPWPDSEYASVLHYPKNIRNLNFASAECF